MKIITILLLSLLISPYTTEPLPSTDDYNIINATFHHLVMPQPELPEELRDSVPPPQFAYDNFPSDRYPASFMEDIYFTQYLSDSILPKERKEHLEAIKSNDFQGLYQQLMTESQPDKKLDTIFIQNTGRFKLTPIDISQEVDMKSSERAVVSYSSIVYNDDTNKAVFYFDYHSYGMRSFGTFVFVEKVDEIWTITESVLAYVS